jgi:hypothetical protein
VTGRSLLAPCLLPCCFLCAAMPKKLCLLEAAGRPAAVGLRLAEPSTQATSGLPPQNRLHPGQRRLRPAVQLPAREAPGESLTGCPSAFTCSAACGCWRHGSRVAINSKVSTQQPNTNCLASACVRLPLCCCFLPPFLLLPTATHGQVIPRLATCQLHDHSSRRAQPLAGHWQQQGATTVLHVLLQMAHGCSTSSLYLRLCSP